MEEVKNQLCPMCGKKAMTLTEDDIDVPYFDKLYVFSMTCLNCKYHKADVEAVETKEPCKFTFEVNGEKDLKVRVVKSANATVKIPHIMTIDPGPAASGYVTNIEGILNRVKYAIETAREDAEDNSAKKKAKNMLKKINKVIWGKEKLKIIIEDPSGNSAIISDKAVRSGLKK